MLLKCLYLMVAEAGILFLAHSYLDPSEILPSNLPCLRVSPHHILHMALDFCTWAAEQKPLIKIYSGQNIFSPS